MLTQPTAEHLIGLFVATRTARWGKVSEMIDAEIAAYTKRLLGAKDMREIGQMQGSILALQSIQDLVRDAPDLLEKLGTKLPL